MKTPAASALRLTIVIKSTVRLLGRKPSAKLSVPVGQANPGGLVFVPAG